MRHAVALLALAALACETKLPPPHRLPAPPPDGVPALLGAPGQQLSPRLASYKIDARLDRATKTIVATETLTWRHDGVAPVSEVPLHLYMNAFKNEDTVFMRESHGHHRSAHQTADSWGSIDVPSIKTADGTELRPSASYGEDPTTLWIPLPKPVAPGETLALTMTFTTTLPEAFARTGYAGEFIVAGQWFPKIGVLQTQTQSAAAAASQPATSQAATSQPAQAWHCDTFHVNSEFFADFGVYDVTLTTADSDVVIGTGVLVSATDSAPGQRTFVYHAEDVHDFVFIADPYLQVDATTAKSALGEVLVRVYHRPDQASYAARHLEAAKRTIELYGALFGAYPWSIMSVVDPPPEGEEAMGGMEYPTVVTTAGDLVLPAGVYLPEQVTVHEVGHNWFQGLLASNEVDEAFLDEGINQYANGLVLDDWHGADRSAVDLSFLHLGYYFFERSRVDDALLPYPIALRSYDYPERAYFAATYGKMLHVLKTMEGLYGRERFLAALGRYAARGRFHHPTRIDLLDAVGEGLGPAARDTLDQMLLRPGGVALWVSEITTREDVKLTISEVTVNSSGQIEVPVDVDFVFSDGVRETQRWDPRAEGRWSHTYSFTRAAKLVEVEVDPGDSVFLDYDPAAHGVTAEPDTDASWRAAARAGFWEQTLEQVVGL